MKFMTIIGLTALGLLIATSASAQQPSGKNIPDRITAIQSNPNISWAAIFDADHYTHEGYDNSSAVIKMQFDLQGQLDPIGHKDMYPGVFFMDMRDELQEHDEESILKEFIYYPDLKEPVTGFGMGFEGFWMKNGDMRMTMETTDIKSFQARHLIYFDKSSNSLRVEALAISPVFTYYLDEQNKNQQQRTNFWVRVDPWDNSRNYKSATELNYAVKTKVLIPKVETIKGQDFDITAWLGAVFDPEDKTLLNAHYEPLSLDREAATDMVFSGENVEKIETNAAALPIVGAVLITHWLFDKQANGYHHFYANDMAIGALEEIAAGAGKTYKKVKFHKVTKH